MKTKISPHIFVNLKLFLVLLVIILALVTFSSNVTGQESTKLKTDVKPPPPQRPSRYEVIGNDTVYSYTNEMPQFTGGNDGLKKFKIKNLKYPKKIKKLGIEGMVLVRFIIEKNGSVSDIKIMRGASPSLDAEAIRVTKLMPAWQPGKENGKPVKFMFMTGFDFLLTPRTPPVFEEGAPEVTVHCSRT